MRRPLFQIEGESKTARQPLTDAREKEFVRELIIKYNHDYAKNFVKKQEPMLVKSKSVSNLKEKIKMFREN